jgi:glycosyltransferase involved in cell wall biosynthesis
MTRERVSAPRRRAALSVGVNLIWMGEHAGGIGRATVELLGALLELAPGLRLVGFTARRPPAALVRAPWAGEVEWVELPVARDGPPLHLAAQLGALAPLAVAKRLDVLHAPATVGPPLAPGVATVSTLYDLIWLHEGDAWGTARAQRSTRALFTLCARRADRVLTSSEASKRDIVATLKVDPDRVDVALLGVRAPPATPPAELDLPDGPIVLSVAQRRPYKNLLALVRALPEIGGATLVLAGSPNPHDAALRALAAELGVAGRVRLLDHVSDAELEALYRAATCFALPSLMEGFGLPVLEAMARGVPVACSDRWALPEVAGDAALLFDPADQAAVTGALRRLLREPELRRDLAVRGAARARAFTWRRTAEATLGAFERARYGEARAWPRGRSATR